MGRKKTARPPKNSVRSDPNRKKPKSSAAQAQSGQNLPRAVQLFQAGRLVEARDAAKIWATKEPHLALPWNLLGICEGHLGNFSTEVEAFRKASARSPNDADTHNNLATALWHRLALEDALEAARGALHLRPDFPNAENTLGNILRELGESEQAAAAYRRALALEPALAEAHNGLGNALYDADQVEEAASSYREALRLASQYPQALFGLGRVYSKLGAFRDAATAYRKVLEIEPFYPDVHSYLLMLLLYDPVQTKEELFWEHRRWAEQQAGDLHAEPLAVPSARNDKPLTIGLVGGMFKRHPSLWMSLGALEKLASRGHSIYTYSHGSPSLRDDDFTQRLAEISQIWRSITGLDAVEAAQTIRADGPDVLINMVGHAESRMRIFAQRAASIQIQWKGYNTTGLKAMDWFLGDSVEIPPGEDQWFTERVYRLPDDYIAYLPPEKAPNVGPLPMSRNPDGDSPTFGSFNHPAKVNERVAALWARILDQVPNSRLFLKGTSYDEPRARKRILELFAEQGVGQDRLHLENPAPHHELLGAYNRIDIGLDTWPYSGGLTTLEALWMGVPTISLPGPTFAGRHSATHLVNAGLPELVAKDEDDYVAKAVAWANDPEGLGDLRASLRDQVAQSPVCDQERFAENLEEAFRYMITQN